MSGKVFGIALGCVTEKGNFDLVMCIEGSQYIFFMLGSLQCLVKMAHFLDNVVHSSNIPSRCEMQLALNMLWDSTNG